jgi:hypothetical protein
LRAEILKFWVLRIPPIQTPFWRNEIIVWKISSKNKAAGTFEKNLKYSLNYNQKFRYMNSSCACWKPSKFFKMSKNLFLKIEPLTFRLKVNIEDQWTYWKKNLEFRWTILPFQTDSFGNKILKIFSENQTPSTPFGSIKRFPLISILFLTFNFKPFQYVSTIKQNSIHFEPLIPLSHFSDLGLSFKRLAAMWLQSLAHQLCLSFSNLLNHKLSG